MRNKRHHSCEYSLFIHLVALILISLRIYKGFEQEHRVLNVCVEIMKQYSGQGRKIFIFCKGGGGGRCFYSLMFFRF
jgi:hypothetical protein